MAPHLAQSVRCLAQSYLSDMIEPEFQKPLVALGKSLFEQAKWGGGRRGLDNGFSTLLDFILDIRVWMRCCAVYIEGFVRRFPVAACCAFPFVLAEQTTVVVGLSSLAAMLVPYDIW